MEWIEMIKVQTAGSKASVACKDYLAQFQLEKNASDPPTIKKYQNAHVDGSHAILLRWSTAPPGDSGSHLAQQLGNLLKDYGMVSHSVWIASS